MIYLSVGGVRALADLPGFRGPWRRLRRLAAALRPAHFRRGRAHIHAEASEVDLGRVPAHGACVLVAQGRTDAQAVTALLRVLTPLRPDRRLIGPAGPTPGAAHAWLARGCAVVVADAEGALALAQQSRAPLVPALVVAGRRRWSAPGFGDAARIRIATPLEPRELETLPDAAARRAALAWRWLALEQRAEPGREARSGAPPAPVAARGDADALRAEAQGLSPLLPHDRFLVAAARAPEIPALLQEIGRLREIAFRDAGEGTGREIDLDIFDRTYTHLLVWDRRAAELVGAYRLAPTERILPAFGPRGLYTNTLFAYGSEFLERLGPAVELGRSFVRPEYQRSCQALLLLWRGIARLLARELRTFTLFGAVSVSARYSAFSRLLMARGLSAQRGAPELAGFVRPRRPLSAGMARHLPALAGLGGDPATVTALVADAEADGKAPPVLVGEYLKLGGRFLAWNVDPEFGDALDGLVVVDLRRAPRRLLQFYMGRSEAAAFLERSQAA